ncbi:MAG: AraC family transcriptional regulator [Oscillospiraceae bacterium]|nr:AraC family transcriptional regulator [Oscillospiraceae bacterium]
MEIFPDLELHYFVYKSCNENWHLPREIHNAYGMTIVLEGESYYKIDGKDYHVKEGDVLLTRPGMEREATTSGMVCAAVDFDLKATEMDMETVSHFKKTEALKYLIREFQYEWLGKMPGYKLKCCGFFMLMLYELQYGGQSGTNYHVEKIKRYIIDNYSKQIKVETVANMLGLSTVYCGALFRRAQGMTIANFVNEIRIRKAAEMFEAECMSICEVSAACGFNDVYYFSKTFKKIMGVAPSRWACSCGRKN